MPRRNDKSDVIPSITLPRGLREFEASLHDLDYVEELIGRLPKRLTKKYRMLLTHAMTAATAAEEAAKEARNQVRYVAWIAWGTCLENMTIPELQRATGYKDED